MSRAAKDFAGAAIGVGMFGVGPVAAMLVADEVERSRCGIGCIIEKVEGKFVVHRTMKDSNQSETQNNSGLEEGDIILKIDDHWIHPYHTMQEVSAMIRGTEGTPVQLVVSKWRYVDPLNLSIVRRRLPGAKAELLGALWQSPTASTTKPPQPLTLEEKLETLDKLHVRGNLSKAEYENAQRRLKEGSITEPQKPANLTKLPSALEIADALGGDLQRMMGIHRDQAVASLADRLAAVNIKKASSSSKYLSY